MNTSNGHLYTSGSIAAEKTSYVYVNVDQIYLSEEKTENILFYELNGALRGEIT